MRITEVIASVLLMKYLQSTPRQPLLAEKMAGNNRQGLIYAEGFPVYATANVGRWEQTIRVFTSHNEVSLTYATAAVHANANTSSSTTTGRDGAVR
jgi:hypothetical protein